MSKITTQLNSQPLDVGQVFAQACDLHQAGDLAGAERLYQQVLAGEAGHAGAWLHLGLIRQAQGHADQAVSMLARALRLDPASSSAHYNLAMILRDLGRNQEALPLLERAAALEPAWPHAWLQWGRTLVEMGRHAEALAPLQQALNLKPGWLPVLLAMAQACRELGQSQAAQACLLEALGQAPHSADLWLRLGQCRQEAGQDGPALEALAKAAELEPGLALAHLGLGRLLYPQGRIGQARESLLRAVRLDPGLSQAWASLGAVRWAMGQADQAIEATRRALDLSPEDPALHSNLLMLMQYSPACGPEERLQAARQWDRRHGPARPEPLSARARHPDRPLRVGYLSGDLGAHPVGWFLEAALPRHDPRRVTAICLADQEGEDHLSQRLRQAAANWINVRALSHEELFSLIRAQEIDILLDLAGHTAPNRLPVLACRAAPVQATWLGYCATTGLAAMDYIIADPHIIPPAEERQYVERVARLPHCYICLAPPDPCPQVGSLPALAKGHLTLASFNTMAKVTPQVVDLWAELMGSLPGARLLLRNRQLSSPAVRRRYEELFAARGVESSRLDLAGGGSRLDMLAAYNQADLALDPFPFGGGLTTFEALWMGLPVAAMSGDRFVGHHAETILRTVGLGGLVAADEAGYLATVRSLAADPPALAGLRAGMRQRLLASPLMDAEAYTRALEDLLERMWEEKSRGRG